MREHPLRITDMLALLTLAVFALCVLLVLLTGAGLYRDLTDSGETAYNQRTALAYLTTRVQQAQKVTTHEADGLILEDAVDGERYTTRIYCYEGWLRELYTVPGAQIAPEYGEKLLQAESLSVSLEDQLLTINIGKERLLLYLPTGAEVSP